MKISIGKNYFNSNDFSDFNIFEIEISKTTSFMNYRTHISVLLNYEALMKYLKNFMIKNPFLLKYKY